MTENADDLPGAAEHGGPVPTPTPDEAKPVEAPVKFFGMDPEDDDNLYDFRPVVMAADTPDEDVELMVPKGLSVQESAESSPSEEPTVSESPASPEPPVTVVKDSGQPKEEETGTQTSSTKTQAGKSRQPAKT